MEYYTVLQMPVDRVVLGEKAYEKVFDNLTTCGILII